MNPAFKSLNLEHEFYIPEDCYITELCNAPEDPAISIAQARVLPGVTTRWHRLRGTIERYYILSGTGCMEVGNIPPQDVKPGDVVLIPPMCRQRITNTGTADLIFLAICSPGFKQQVYEDVEEDSQYHLR